MKYDLDSAMAYAGSWAEMERDCHFRSKDDPYYQGYVSGMAEMIYLIYEDDIDESDTLCEIKDFIENNCLYFSRRKLGLEVKKLFLEIPKSIRDDKDALLHLFKRALALAHVDGDYDCYDVHLDSCETQLGANGTFYKLAFTLTPKEG